MNTKKFTVDFFFFEKHYVGNLIEKLYSKKAYGR